MKRFNIEQCFYGWLWLAIVVALPASSVDAKVAKMQAVGAICRAVPFIK